MPRDLKGWARPRPLRVAFLVQDGEHAQLALDGVFADCYNRWGGRFSLIAPCINGQIAQSYWPWLEAFDADIVYSYVPLSREAILEVHERLSPSQYTFHEMGREPRLDVYGFKPSYGFLPLSSLSVIFRLARYSAAARDGAPVKIIDSWHTEKPSRFLTDNFGTYHVSRGGGLYPVYAAAMASLITIVSPERQADRRYGVPQNLNAVPTENAAFKEFAERRATSLSLASTVFAPKLDIRTRRWSGSFNLVVGDTFVDRIIFWNARLLIPAWLDTDLCCARITVEQLKEPEFLNIVGELIKRHNYVNGGTGGQPQLTIRSASLSTEQLQEARALLLTTKPWSVFGVETVASLDDIVPSSDAIQEARESNGLGGGLIPRPDWTGFIWSAPTVRPPAIVPDHLTDAPARQIFTEGFWCTDFIFQYDGLGPRFVAENRWELPRRWRMAGAFRTKMISEPRHVLVPPARRSRGGNLAVFVSSDHPIETIKIPTPYEATQHALAGDGIWANPEAEHGVVYPKSKVFWIEPSNESRYLAGILGMIGGVGRARQVLLHPFLQETLARLGGTPNIPADKITPTAARLQKRARREAAFDLRNPEERQALADLIVKAARELKSPMHYVSYQDLKLEWKVYRQRYWAKNPPPETPDSDESWDRREEDSLDACLIEMRRRQIMFQGHQWTCGKCHHRNWVDLAALGTELTCEVCKQKEQAPVDIRWLFRPNEFLIDSLRDHSVLSLIWLLSKLCDRARRSFMFVAPTCFGFERESTSPSAEADLLVVADGRAILCEVKSSWRVFRTAHLAAFVALARRLRPDVALLGVMEEGPGPAAELHAASEQLATEGIQFEVITLQTSRLDDGPYLDIDD